MKTQSKEPGSVQGVSVPISDPAKITPELIKHYVAEGRHLRSAYVVDFFKRLWHFTQKGLARNTARLNVGLDRARNLRNKIAAEGRKEGCRDCG